MTGAAVPATAAVPAAAAMPAATAVTAMPHPALPAAAVPATTAMTTAPDPAVPAAAAVPATTAVTTAPYPAVPAAVTLSASVAVTARPDVSVERAWELSYLDPESAGALGLRMAATGDATAATGWLHVALAEVRTGDATVAARALERARTAFDVADDTLGLALCNEVKAMALRRDGDATGSQRLQTVADAGRVFEVGATGRSPCLDAMVRFLAHNSRALTCKLLGQSDQALRHFYAAREAADETGWDGPRITAASNLGGYHHSLFNLDDARTLSEQALHDAREAGVRQAVGNSAINLIAIYHAAGEPRRARAMAEFILTHPEELIADARQRYALSLALAHLAVGEIDDAQRYLRHGAVVPLADGDGDGATFWGWLQARCLLARGDAAGAREVAERTLQQRHRGRNSDAPQDLMQLHATLADACEVAGDPAAALGYMRQQHKLYEMLVGRSARARYIALEVGHQLARAQQQRDLAVDSQRSAEDGRRRLVELNAALQAKAGETEMLHARLREQALRDPLTGLHNRRYLFEIAPGLLELARRQAKPLCVVLIDLDHFKLLNDTCGHQAGDLVLQRFSQMLTQMLRRSDVVCRHGGEEFVVVMPDLDGDDAQVVLQRLLEAFQAQQLELGRRRLPRGSFSAGVAVFPRHGNTLEQLLSRADRGLYAAKNHGRARIELAPDGTGFGTLS